MNMHGNTFYLKNEQMLFKLFSFSVWATWRELRYLKDRADMD